MRNEIIESITYIIIIYGIWLAGFTGFTLYFYFKKHHKYLWMFYLGFTILISIFIFGIVGALASKL